MSDIRPSIFLMKDVQIIHSSVCTSQYATKVDEDFKSWHTNQFGVVSARIVSMCADVWIVRASNFKTKHRHTISVSLIDWLFGKANLKVQAPMIHGTSFRILPKVVESNLLFHATQQASDGGPIISKHVYRVKCKIEPRFQEPISIVVRSLLKGPIELQTNLPNPRTWRATGCLSVAFGFCSLCLFLYLL